MDEALMLVLADFPAHIKSFFHKPGFLDCQIIRSCLLLLQSKIENANSRKDG